MNDEEVIITMRVLMVGKEIGGIIGKGGATIASFREKSGARIHISTQQSASERIVTITGDQAQVQEAFRLICNKIETDINSGLSTSATSKVPITLKLIVPASQCGSIIGKGGSKIKEIRDTTACAIKVHSDMLPNSTERAVTLSGAPSAIVHCIDMLCNVMIEFPARMATVPYKPTSDSSPVIFHQGQTYMLQGQIAVPGDNIPKLQVPVHSITPSSGQIDISSTNQRRRSANNEDKAPPTNMNLPTRLVDANTQELTVSNEIIGSIIGKGGTRINEIRSMSGAQVIIDRGQTDGEVKDRKITITGTPEAISLAQYLINTSIQLFLNQKKADKTGLTTGIATNSEPQQDEDPKPLMSLYTQPAIPLNQLLGGSSNFGSLLGATPFGTSPFTSLQGGASGSFSMALHNAKRSFVSKTSGRAPRYSSYRGKNTKAKSEGRGDKKSDAGGDVVDDGLDSKDRKKTRREKFNPY